MGLAVSGSGFGMMFIPPLLDYYIALVNPQLAVSPSLSLSLSQVSILIRNYIGFDSMAGVRLFDCKHTSCVVCLYRWRSCTNLASRLRLDTRSSSHASCYATDSSWCTLP
jgi:hypothetical protein